MNLNLFLIIVNAIFTLNILNETFSLNTVENFCCNFTINVLEVNFKIAMERCNRCIVNWVRRKIDVSYIYILFLILIENKNKLIYSILIAQKSRNKHDIMVSNNKKNVI